MQDRPEFDSTHPDDVALTPEEQAAVNEGMRRRRELQAAEDEIPDIGDRRPQG
jgi:hypothetical protein